MQRSFFSFLLKCRLQSQAARVRPPRRQQQGAKNPLRQIQATIPIVDEYTEIHTNLSEQEIRRLKRAQSTRLTKPSSSHSLSLYFSCRACWCRSRSSRCISHYGKLR